MATPSLAMIPSAYADSKVYSVLPNNGDGDFTFNRDSSATRVGQNGLIQTVGYFGNNLVTNGDFATDSDWTKSPTGNIANGKANYDDTSTNAMYQNGITITAGKSYKVTFTISNASSTAHMTIFDYANSDVLLANENWANGTYERIFTSTNNETGISIWGNTAGSSFSIDNVSLQEITGDQPRLNYDISNGVVQSCPSLLLEPASTNLITYSESMNQYTPVNGTITANALTSPEGLLNAVKFAENSANNLHYFDSNSISVTSGTKYTISVFAKYNGRFLTFQGSGALNSAFATFNLQNGTIEQQSVGTASIEKMPNDWYRCSIIVEMTQTGNAVMSILLNDSATGGRSRSYQGDGASGIYLYGFQTEALSYATSYIPTNGSSQTRAAETCFGAGTAATFNSIEGVFYCEIAALSNTNSFEDLSFSDGTSNNKIQFFLSGTNSITARVTAGGSTQFNHSYTSSDVTQFTKYAIKYKVNDFSMYVNGVQQSVGTSGSTFSANTLNTIIINDGNISDLEGKIRDIRVFNEALTDAQLQTLTTL